MSKKITITVNGRGHIFHTGIDLPESETLVETIRERLLLTGTKRPCNEGGCGGCTVLVDGVPTLSCSTLTAECDGKEILTIEGLENPVTHELHPIQQAFIDVDAIQCGMCTPGITLTAKALLDHNPDPTRQQIAEALSGNICRCTGYEKYFDGIELAARRMREAADQERTEADQKKAAADQKEAAADQERTEADQKKAAADQKRTEADQKKAAADQKKAAADQKKAGADQEKGA